MTQGTGTLNLIKAGIDTVLKIQTKAGKPTYERIGPTINHKQGFYRSRIITGFGDASVVSAGQPVPSDNKLSLYETDYYPLKFAKAYEYDVEADEDDVYGEVGNFAADLSKAMRRRKNKEMANLLNNAFDSNYPIYDAQPLCSTAHPGLGSNTGANRSSVAKAFGALNLEDEMTAMMSQVDPRGENLELEGNMIIHVGNTLWPLASRVVDASGLAQTNDNDPNFAGKYMSVDRQDKMTSATSWFLKMANQDEHGLRMIQFTPYKIITQQEARTVQNLVVVYERYIACVLQWYGLQGNPGQ